MMGGHGGMGAGGMGGNNPLAGLNLNMPPP